VDCVVFVIDGFMFCHVAFHIFSLRMFVTNNFEEVKQVFLNLSAKEQNS